jgi:hypothetical protein
LFLYHLRRQYSLQASGKLYLSQTPFGSGVARSTPDTATCMNGNYIAFQISYPDHPWPINGERVCQLTPLLHILWPMAEQFRQATAKALFTSSCRTPMGWEPGVLITCRDYRSVWRQTSATRLGTPKAKLNVLSWFKTI